MKTRLFSFFLLALTLCVTPQAFAQQYVNYPLPHDADTLRILGIGNSFTDDGMMYLPELLEAAGIHNVILARLYIGGCTLERHCNEYTQNTPSYIYWKSVNNQWVKVNGKATMLEGLEDEPWDIVTFQQNSGRSGIYSTYQPYLNQLMDIVRQHCSNAGATLAWHQTWSYARTSNQPDFMRYDHNSELMYRSIMNCSKQLQQETPIHIVIPVGTAIQNMRQTAHCDSLDLTRDGFHLSMRLGRYTAACTWYQTLIAPVLKKHILHNPCRLEGTENELTAEEAEAARMAALHAWMRLYTVWK